LSGEQRDKWLADQRVVDDATSCVLQSIGEENTWRKLSICSQGLRLMPHNSVLLEEEDNDLSDIQSLLNMDKTDLVNDSAQAMIARDSGMAAGWILLSWTLQRSGQLFQAIAAAQTAVAKAPWSLSALDNCANILLQAQAYDEAIARCDTAVRLAPDHARSRVLRGMVLYIKGRFNDAIAEFSRVVQLQPRNVFAWCRLGDIYRDMNSLSLSEQAYREALRIDPNNVDANNGLNALAQQ
jgi:cytochrome c-type biogenesis protein CcmH/NrfG